MQSDFRLVTLSKMGKPPGESMLLPESEMPSMRQHEEQRQRKETEKYISKMVQQQPIRKIISFFKKNRGKNYATKYHPEFNFMEKWETSHKGADLSKISMDHLSGFYPWMNFAVLPLFITQIWLFSIYRVFQYQNCEWLFILGVIEQIFSLVYSCISLFKIIDMNMDIVSQLSVALADGGGWSLVGNIFDITYYVLLIINISDIRSSLYFLPFDCVTIVFSYIRIEKIYSKIRIKAIGSKHKHFMHLFDLGSSVLILIHIFSVLLYLCIYYSPNINWLSLNPFLVKDGWIFHYIYSIYFTCTTMLTVGYGDFHATNQLEIMCILLIQFFGIVSNGYAISQIGVNLAQMRSSRDALESDLSNAEKLAKFNAMPPQLKEDMREELVKNQQVNDELSLKEEERILDKLNDELKEQICVTNQINIVKTSLFILCHFGKRIQLQISKRMIKVIYPPNAALIQIYGKEKLFVLAKGTIQIMTQKKWKHRCFSEKLLKIMQKNANNQNQVYRNVYGYSAMLSGKPSRLKAVSKSFAVCYTLQHQDIIDFIIGGEEDFQRYHILKNKFQLTNLPEKIQVPEILTTQQHYNPNIFLLIYKYIKSRKHVNHRKWGIRRKFRCKLVIQLNEDDTNHNPGSMCDSEESEVSNIGNQINEMKILKSSKRIKSQLNQMSNRMLPSNQKKQLNLLSKPRVYANRDRNNKKYQQLRAMRLQEKFPVFMKEEVYTESYHEYKRYLPRGNISNVLPKVNKGKMAQGDLNMESRLEILRHKQNLKPAKQWKYSS